MTWIKLPFDRLSSDALYGVIEEFVTRDGTDYGEHEIPLDQKISQVLGQLKSGRAILVYDEASCSCNILHHKDPALKFENAGHP